MCENPKGKRARHPHPSARGGPVKGRVLTLALALVPAAARAQTPPLRPAGNEMAAIEREPFRDAPGVTPIADPLRDTGGTRDTRVRIEGFLRTRGDLAHNWGLGVGPGPSGVRLLAHALQRRDTAHPTNLDTRLRLDAHAEVGYGVSLHGRIHALDNLRWGSTPDADFARALWSPNPAPIAPSTCVSCTARCSCPSACSPRGVWAPSSIGVRASSSTRATASTTTSATWAIVSPSPRPSRASSGRRCTR